MRRPGRDVSLVTYGNSLPKCLAAAASLATKGIDAEVIDLRVLRPLDMEPEVFRTHWHALTVILAKEAMKLGGTLSAEHGIGRLKRGEFEELVDPVSLDLMRRIRKMMDPEGRMNPGAIFS